MRGDGTPKLMVLCCLLREDLLKQVYLRRRRKVRAQSRMQTSGHGSGQEQINLGMGAGQISLCEKQKTSKVSGIKVTTIYLIYSIEASKLGRVQLGCSSPR